MPSEPSKDALRSVTLSTRRDLAPDQSVAESARNSRVIAALGSAPGTVSVYVSRDGEPDTRRLIDTLAAAGWRILLPIVSGGAAAPDWAWFSGWDATRPAWGGIPEPTGERLGPEGLALADVVLVPCLGVGLDGSRLGTGGGWYDRALVHRRTGSPIWALARDAEVVATLPREAHDVLVDAVVTESAFVPLPASDGPRPN